jgi:peptide/nickel transport system permease protein
VTTYVLRRLLVSLPVIFGILVAVFVITRILPGDPCRALLGEKATEAACAAFNSRYGFDQPMFIQFVRYLGQVLTGDLGDSIRFGIPVTQLLLERLPTTVELGLISLTIASVAGIFLGITSATRRNSRTDVVTMIFANLGVSIPVFVLGLIFAFFFAIVLKGTPLALPPSGRYTAGVIPTEIAEAWGLSGLGGPLRVLIDFISNMAIPNAILTLRPDLLIDAISHLFLPAIALATIPMAVIARITRSSLLDVLGTDYIRTARAKGLSPREVVSKHALRNALLPVVTVIGLSLGGLLSGAVLTETIFNFAGVGRTISEAITARDYVVVQGFTVVVSIGYVVVNLLVDISYAYLDPRVRMES